MAAGIEPVRGRDLLSFIRTRTKFPPRKHNSRKAQKNAIATRFEGFER